MIRFFIFFLFLTFISYNLKSQENTIFSHQPGFYNSSFYLKIDTTDSRVLYAFQNNLNRRSRIYRDSIFIDKTTTLNFAFHRNDSIISLGSKTFFINFETEFHVVSLSLSRKSLYDSISGIYMDGPNSYYDSTLQVKLGSNFSKKMEKDVFVEIFDANKSLIVSQDAGFRIFGGMTIYYPEKSLRLIARNSYGIPRFNANIFGQGKKKYKFW